MTSEYIGPMCMCMIFVNHVRSILELSSAVLCPYADNWIKRIEKAQNNMTKHASKMAK